MRYLIYCVLLITIPGIASAQRVFEGQVVDKETEATIPGVTVKLLKENKGTQTNNRGYYKLVSTDTIATDSLQFTSIGYKTFRISVKAYQQNMFIVLEASTTQLKGVTITKKPVPRPVLHKFSMADVREIRYEGSYQNRTWPYAARHMVAMEVKAKHKNVRIASLNIGRREFDENYYPNGTRAIPSPHTRFLVHVMSVDEKTGKPDQKLYTRQVNLSDNSLMVVIDVSQDNWTIAGDTFFVAVEWLRQPINEILQLEAEEVVRRTTRDGDQKLADAPNYRVLYQPAITRYEDSRKYNAYFMNQPGNWQRLMYDQDRKPTTLAISATILN